MPWAEDTSARCSRGWFREFLARYRLRCHYLRGFFGYLYAINGLLRAATTAKKTATASPGAVTSPPPFTNINTGQSGPNDPLWWLIGSAPFPAKPRWLHQSTRGKSFRLRTGIQPTNPAPRKTTVPAGPATTIFTRSLAGYRGVQGGDAAVSFR
jgi:hypothetical protein